jgi:hypothetical protein
MCRTLAWASRFRGKRIPQAHFAAQAGHAPDQLIINPEGGVTPIMHQKFRGRQQFFGGIIPSG